MGCGIIHFSVLDSLFFSFEALPTVLDFLKPFIKGNNVAAKRGVNSILVPILRF